MKALLLTGTGIEHQYVAARVAAAFGDGLVGVYYAVPRGSFAAKLRGWWRRYTLGQLASRLAAKAYRKLVRLDARHHQRLTHELFGAAPPPGLPQPERQAAFESLNAPACVAAAQQLRPDVIIVYGTAVIRRNWIDAFPGRIVNLHTGLSPWYRGADTLFWPIHDGAPDRLGVTVHLLDAGLDSGPILATERVAFVPGDDEASIFARGVRVGADLLARSALRLAAGDATGQPQALEAGKEFRFVDRTVAAELRVWWRLRAARAQATRPTP